MPCNSGESAKITVNFGNGDTRVFTTDKSPVTHSCLDKPGGVVGVINGNIVTTPYPSLTSSKSVQYGPGRYSVVSRYYRFTNVWYSDSQGIVWTAPRWLDYINILTSNELITWTFNATKPIAWIGHYSNWYFGSSNNPTGSDGLPINKGTTINNFYLDYGYSRDMGAFVLYSDGSRMPTSDYINAWSICCYFNARAEIVSITQQTGTSTWRVQFLSNGVVIYDATFASEPTVATQTVSGGKEFKINDSLGTIFKTDLTTCPTVTVECFDPNKQCPEGSCECIKGNIKCCIDPNSGIVLKTITL